MNIVAIGGEVWKQTSKLFSVNSTTSIACGMQEVKA